LTAPQPIEWGRGLLRFQCNTDGYAYEWWVNASEIRSVVHYEDGVVSVRTPQESHTIDCTVDEVLASIGWVNPQPSSPPRPRPGTTDPGVPSRWP